MKIIRLLLTLSILCMVFTVPAMAADKANISLEVTGEEYEVGEVFDISINLQNVVDLYGFELHLSFNPEVVEVVEDANSSEDGIQVTRGDILGSANTFIPVNKADNSKGIIDFAVTDLGDHPGYSGNGKLCSIKLKAKGLGKVDFKILDKSLLVSSEVQNIAYTMDSANIIVKEEKAEEGNTEEENGGNIETPEPTNPEDITETETSEINDNLMPTNPHNNIQFPDLNNHWARKQVQQLVALGIVNGYSDGFFRPGDNVRRDEFCKMLVIALGLEIEDKTVLQFTDKNEVPAWSAPYLATAVNAGIITGYNDNTVRAGAHISRAEMAVMMERALKLKGILGDAGNVSEFVDNDKIPAWAASAVKVMKQKAVIGGYPDGSFGPLNKATRAETSVMLSSLVNIIRQ